MLQAAKTFYKIYFYLCRCAQYEVVWFLSSNWNKIGFRCERGKSPLKYVVSVKLLSEGISTFHVEGIKENKALTKILAAKITNETDKLQERFQKMTALYGKQIEKSQYVERYLEKLLSSIALLLTGNVSGIMS
jgi:hypothetical protein